ncbi:flagellar hook-associated protein FlgL [Desulfovibrio sp. OttesenSCG-928-C14]|nr:flagellar hook-associated protein FlgL [Desulfovibrio sp. OttesenSCG-928-C14]
MAIRVSQRMMYTSMLYNMNSNLSDLMESNLQSSSQKRINRPSDDPYGAAQVLASRNTIANIKQYADNLSMAKGWLNSTDNALALIEEELTSLQGILQQGSTGTYVDDQKESLAEKARGILDQIISLANTKFNGRYIFSGHKTDTSPFRRDLGVTATDPATSDMQFKVNGDSSAVVVVQFTENGTISQTGAESTVNPGQPPAFRYTTDGGDTWHQGTWSADGKIMYMSANPGTGVSMEPVVGTTPINVTAVDDLDGDGLSDDPDKPVNKHSGDNGSWFYIRPTAQYYGDTNDTIAHLTYPPSNPANATVDVSGNFNRDVSVRVDSVAGGRVTYSYSVDDGQNWTTSITDIQGAPPSANLPVPGGYMNLSAPNMTDLEGNQFIIKPYRADIELTIGSNSSVVINNVGRDIFGGIYNPPFSEDGPQADPVDMTQNLFEILGNAIAYLETGSQSGCQETLDNLNKYLPIAASYRTQTGARINQADSIAEQLETLRIDEEDRLSSVEDADVSELLTRLAQQQLAYNSILKSSSMIMQMSLMNFL